MSTSTIPAWQGDYWYLLKNLILKDFKVRYRNMSLGVLWSVGNPLVIMGVLTFVFTVLLPTDQERFPVFLLAGLVPFNFFSLGWSIGTTSVADNAHLVKRVNFPREIVPVSAVLANCVHFAIQIGLLLTIAAISRVRVTPLWLYVPLLAVLEVVFVTGLAMMTAAVNVYVRDTRYVVESAAAVMFWLVPVVYPFDRIQPAFKPFVHYNPIAAVIMGYRNVLLEGHAPAASILWKLVVVSALSIAAGTLVFHRMKHHFFDHL